MVKKTTSAWFLTIDNSVIAHGLEKRVEGGAPYSIKLETLLHTLSPFVESQVLKGEFEDLFSDLIAKDLLPKEQLLNAEDLKMLVGIDIKARDIPPEIIRKAMAHVKREILKGGGLTEENKDEVAYQFTKYIMAPEKSIVEMQKRYERKLQLRDEDVKQKNEEIKSLQKEKKNMKSKEESKISQLESDLKKKDEILYKIMASFGLLILSGVLWLFYFLFINFWDQTIKNPVWLSLTVQILLISVYYRISFPKQNRVIEILEGITAIACLTVGLLL